MEKRSKVTINTSIVKRRKLGYGDIFINAAKCRKCGDTVQSKHRHDFVACGCGAIAVDGGSWYARRSGDFNACEEKIIMFKKQKSKKDKSEKINAMMEESMKLIFGRKTMDDFYYE